VKVPFLQNRQTSMICPHQDVITVKKHPLDPTGEAIIIHPGRKN